MPETMSSPTKTFKPRNPPLPQAPSSRQLRLPAAVLLAMALYVAVQCRSRSELHLASTNVELGPDNNSAIDRSAQPPRTPRNAPSGASSRRCPAGTTPAKMRRGDDETCAEWRAAVRDQRMCAVREPDAKYVVCVPGKNGSTYHRGLIYRILGVKGYYIKGEVHFNMEARSRMDMEHFSNKEIEGLMTDDDVPRYAMIRNPMQRTLSGYLTTRASHLPAGTDKKEDFRNFVRVYLKGIKDVGKLNTRVRPQMEFCGFRRAGWKKKYRLFRVEEPDTYVDFLEEYVPAKYIDNGWGKAKNLTFREFVLGPRTRTHGTDEQFFEYVRDLDVFDVIADRMGEDIDFLGYREDVTRQRKELEAWITDRRE